MTSRLPTKTVIESNVHVSKHRKLRRRKPWWNDELTYLWNVMCNAEKEWNRHRGPRKRHYKAIYVEKRNCFDKCVIKTKRQYDRNTIADIERICQTEQGEFWKRIGKVGVGNSRTEKIPFEVKLSDGRVSRDRATVLGTWKDAYSDLLNCNTNTTGERVERDVDSEDNNLDVNISKDEVRQAILQAKSGSPYGVMPELEIDGKPYFQSSAIVRYLANTFGLYGQGTLEALEVDQVLGIVDDLGNVLIKFMYSKPEDKEENGRQAREEKIPNSMRLFEKLLRANGSGFFVGDSMTVADMAVYSIMDGLKVIPGDPFEGFPLTKQVVERVEADPMIRAWNDRQQQKK